MRTITGNIIFIFLLFACQQDLDVELPEHEPRLVVNSLFNPEEVWQVELSHSSGYGDDEVGFLEDGYVAVWQGSELEEVLIETDTPGIYKGTTTAAPEVNYELVAYAPGYDTVYATDQIPEPVEILEVVWQDSAYQTPEGYGARIQMQIQDPPGEQNYYVIPDRITCDTCLFPIIVSMDDPNFEYFRASSNFRSYFGSGQSFTGSIYLINLDIAVNQAMQIREALSTGDTLKMPVRIWTVSGKMYTYLSTVQMQYSTRHSFVVEPAQVYNNIENGLGIFAGHSVSTKILILHE